MAVKVTPRGTRGGNGPPGFLRPILAILQRPYTAAVRRRGSKMKTAGQPLMVLTTVGANTGKERETVLGYWAEHGGSIVVIGTNMGAAVHPGWLFNMARNPDKVWIERDGVRQRVTPETLEGPERAAFWAEVAAGSARYARYEQVTDREMPIVRLRPVAGS